MGTRAAELVEVLESYKGVMSVEDCADYFDVSPGFVRRFAVDAGVPRVGRAFAFGLASLIALDEAIDEAYDSDEDEDEDEDDDDDDEADEAEEEEEEEEEEGDE